MAQLRFVSHSEVGLVRKNNQDSGFASPTLLVVADGMGGAAAGDLASAVAIDTIKRIIPDPGTEPTEADSVGPGSNQKGSNQKGPTPPSTPEAGAAADSDRPVVGEDMLEVLAGAIHQANDRIADLVEDDYSLDGMGTTVTSLMFDGEGAGLAHIGDSRAYLLRDGALERLTHDHSWVQSLVDEGKITADEAAYHPHRSLLLKVLNGQTANDPDLTMITLIPGDRLMLCSDGVCGLVDDGVIGDALALDSIEEAMERLVSESLAEGGIDNITVIVADVVDAEGAGDRAIIGAAAEREIPSLSGRPRADTHEDTVIRDREAIPAAAPTDRADEARYNPLPPKRYRFVRPAVLLICLALVVGVGLATAYAWTRTQYFVGVAGQQVAIYRGLSEHLPGIALSSVFEVQPLAVAELPPYYQEKVKANIEVASLESARQTVTELTDSARRCSEQRPGSTPSPTSSPSPSPSPSPTVKASAGLTPGPSPSTSSSPSPSDAPSSAVSPLEC